jgi:hypothetical protein
MEQIGGTTLAASGRDGSSHGSRSKAQRDHSEGRSPLRRDSHPKTAAKERRRQGTVVQSLSALAHKRDNPLTR